MRFHAFGFQLRHSGFERIELRAGMSEHFTLDLELLASHQVEAVESASEQGSCVLFDVTCGTLSSKLRQAGSKFVKYP